MNKYRVKAFNFAGLVKLNLAGFIEDPAVEPVLPGVLIATGGPSSLLFYHVTL